MDSAKYQSDIFHAIEMAYECILFPQKGCIFMNDLAAYHNTKSTRTFIECKEVPILDWSENSSDINPITNIWNIMHKEIGNQMSCKNKICGSKYVKRGIV